MAAADCLEPSTPADSAPWVSTTKWGPVYQADCSQGEWDGMAKLQPPTDQRAAPTSAPPAPADNFYTVHFNQTLKPSGLSDFRTCGSRGRGHLSAGFLSPDALSARYAPHYNALDTVLLVRLLNLESYRMCRCHRVQKSMSEPTELEVQASVSFPRWILHRRSQHP